MHQSEQIPVLFVVACIYDIQSMLRSYFKRKNCSRGGKNNVVLCFSFLCYVACLQVWQWDWTLKATATLTSAGCPCTTH